ncbi:MAG: lamin tail domain-containing protein [Myxococcales bacterium]|nr:lamin tail domain-containing protein [Myxococcales bacterium]
MTSRSASLFRLMLPSLCGGLLACDGGSDPKLCDTMLPGSIVISEVFNDAQGVDGQSGADAGREWIEVYNAGAAAQNLKDLDLVSSRLDGSSAKRHVVGDFLLQPGQYAVLASVASDLLPAYAHYGYGADLGEFGNSGGGRVALACGSALIDEAIYGVTASGYSQQLSGATAPVSTANDDGEGWCIATNDGSTEFAAGNYGTPGEANEACVLETATTCQRDGATVAINAPQTGDLIITEILPDPEDGDDDQAEWFEVLVTRDVDLNGVVIAKDLATSTRTVLTDANCLEATAGTRLIFARSTNTEAHDLPRVDFTFDSSLVNDGNGGLVLARGDALLDGVTWLGSDTGQSLQVDPDFESTDGNDSISAWCDGSDLFGATSDLGTPGEPNNECPLSPGVGECIENDAIRDIVTPGVGELIISEVMPSPAGTDANEEWIEFYATAPVDLNGLALDKGAGTTKKVFSSPECLRMVGGEFAIIARNLDPEVNGGLPAALTSYGLGLLVSDALRLRTNEDEEVTTIIDAVSWTGAADDKSRQLSSNALTAEANDIPTNWCPATSSYGDGGNFGTPAADNLSCGS